MPPALGSFRLLRGCAEGVPIHKKWYGIKGRQILHPQNDEQLMEISTAARTAALQNILTSTLSSPSEHLTYREALDGLQLLVGANHKSASDEEGLQPQAVDRTFTTALQIAERPQVRNALVKAVTYTICKYR